MTSKANQRASEVARQIQKAFSDVPYPGDNRLVEGSTQEDVEVAELLRNRKSKVFTIDELRRNHEIVFFMTPEALQFYLPVFLVASVLHYGEAGNIPVSLVFLFTPPDPQDAAIQARFLARFGSFNSGQRDAVKAFAEYLRDEHGADSISASGTEEDATLLMRWWT